MLRAVNSQPLQRLERRQASEAGTIEIRSLEELKELVDKIPEGTVTTRKLAQAGEILDIRMMDHIIVGGGTGEWFSFKENGRWISSTTWRSRSTRRR